jgi:hypothetical protein
MREPTRVLLAMQALHLALRIVAGKKSHIRSVLPRCTSSLISGDNVTERRR